MYVLFTVTQCIVIVLNNNVTSKSCEQRLITKEYIATQANLILLFKPALYSSTLVIKLFHVIYTLKQSYVFMEIYVHKLQGKGIFYRLY